MLLSDFSHILNKNHNLADFECESKDFTNFLKKDALNQQNMNLSLTYVVICDGTVIGYLKKDQDYVESIDDIIKKILKEVSVFTKI